MDLLLSEGMFSKSKRYGGVSRKTRSIGLTCDRICSRFPLIVENGESWEVSVDSVVRTLNASKGSVYEIFHVLEGILVVSKIGTNVYRWNGFQHLRTVLGFLKVIGRDLIGIDTKMNNVKKSELSNLVEKSKKKSSMIGVKNEECIEVEHVDISMEFHLDGTVTFLPPPNVLEFNGSEDPIGIDSIGNYTEDDDDNNNIHILEACQQFVMIFLLAPYPKIITLEYAAKIIYGMHLNLQGVQSRTRRLCDMANVLISLPIPFIEKVQVAGPSGRRTAFKYTGPIIHDMTVDPLEIMKLPDYRRKHLLFSTGKKMLNIPERPEKLSGTVTLRRCIVQDEMGNEYSATQPNNGLDLDRLAVEYWTNLTLEDTIEIEKHRIRFPAIHPIRKRTIYKNQKGNEVDLDLFIYPKSVVEM
ncbi:transcription factor E2F8-like [Lepeophtheirus salmonis]|uniref:E2F transcription factor 8 [Ornithorhynchus anatinus] n=1 Tax=Lepeophtheirus salmonis TaxID=72036 RepID=A0A0K2UWM2_LEPSM|nr:transcription factor E2F7-like [Lepeophtheirus salmonis]